MTNDSLALSLRFAGGPKRMLTIMELGKRDGEERWFSRKVDALPQTVNESSVLWINVEDPSEAELEQLKNRFKIGHLSLEEIKRRGHRSEIEEEEDHVRCFVAFPSRDHFLSDSKPGAMGLFAGNRWIVSVHMGHSSITSQIHRKINAHGYSTLSPSPRADILLYIFLDLIANEYFLVSDLLNERLHKLSQEAGRLFREKSRQSIRTFGLEIAKSREQALALRQMIGPLREVVGRIVRGEFEEISSSVMPRFDDLYDNMISLITVVDTHREQIHDIGDILINVQTLTTNNIVRVLTIISAIFLPLALIAEIYGTNFQTGFFIPGSSSIMGFYFMVVAMIVIASAMIFIFRKKGWL